MISPLPALSVLFGSHSAKILLTLLAAIWTVSGSSHAASAPEWLLPLLQGEAVEWHPREPVVMLLNQSQVRFLGVDRYVMQSRNALRANTTEGAQQLRIRLPYNSDYVKITSIRAWVVSPKGKVTSVSRQGFIDQAGFTDNRYWDHFRVLTYSGAAETELGSVLAWEFVYETPDPLGQCGWGAPLQHGLYRGEFEVVPAPGTQLSWHSAHPNTPSPEAGATPASLVWRVEKNLPQRGALPDGFCAQPLSIRVRCSPKGTPPPGGAEGWALLAASWSKFYSEKSVVTKEIQGIADLELKDKKTRWDRIRALAQYVQKKISYLAVTEDKDVFAGSRPHAASEVVDRKLGDCKDKTTLLITLLRAAGEEGIPALVSSGSPGRVDPEWPSPEFNHVIVAVRSDPEVPGWWPTANGPDGQSYVLFDPTARTLPMGCLPPSDEGGYALLLTPNHGGLMRLTAAASGVPSAQRKLLVTLALDGSAKASGVEETIGTDGAILQSMSEGLSKEQFARYLDQSLRQRGAIAQKLTWSIAWEADDAHFTVHTDFQIAQAARRFGTSQLVFTPLFQRTHFALSPWETNYRGTAWLPRAAFEEEIRLALPHGTTIGELPPPLRLEQGGATAEISYRPDGQAIVCLQRCLRPAGMYSKEDYEKMRLLGEKVAAAQRRPIILRLEQGKGTN